MIRSIGKLANELGISVETVRFYERSGLIEQPIKPQVGHRHYPDAAMNRIRFIKRAQELGFTLNEIKHLLNLNDLPCHQTETLARQKLAAVKEKIADLTRLEKALDELLIQCHDNDNKSHCPVIDSLLDPSRIN